MSNGCGLVDLVGMGWLAAYFSSRGMSKNALPSEMTLWKSSSGMPTFLMYRKPTSISAWRRSARKAGLVAGSLASATSRMGMELNDIVSRSFEDCEGCVNLTVDLIL